ncbi:MAG: hypothetical protein WCY74_05495 [Sphaerochaetaceae bacterium]
MISIQQVVTKRHWRDFFKFPDQLYRGNPYYIPALAYEEHQYFDPKRNPAFEFVESVAFLASDGTQTVGRVAALINTKLNTMKGEHTARFTRFDVIEEFEVARALIDAVITWAKAHGMDKVIGPIGFSDLDKQGLLIEGFDEPGSFITLYNHPYYQEYLERLGFKKDADWVEYRVYVPEQADERIERLCTIAMARNGYELVPFKNKKEVIPYAHRMFHMYNESFSQLYGFCPLSDAQIEMAVSQFFGLVNLDYVIVVVDKKKDVIGFGLMGPSLSEAIRKSGGNLFPLGFLRILKALRSYSILDMYLIAVKPEYFGRGVNAVILNEGIKRAITDKVLYAETGPELETNEEVQSQWKGFKTVRHKRRRCYALDLTDDGRHHTFTTT